jgi:hypothetical protein
MISRGVERKLSALYGVVWAKGCTGAYLDVSKSHDALQIFENTDAWGSARMESSQAFPDREDQPRAASVEREDIRGQGYLVIMGHEAL